MVSRNVTDAGLKELAALKQLQTLDLSDAQVTEAGLKELAGLTQLAFSLHERDEVELAIFNLNGQRISTLYSGRLAAQAEQVIDFDALVRNGMIDAGDVAIFHPTDSVDDAFEFITKTPPAAVLLRKAAGVAKGSGEPNTKKVGTVNRAQLEEIARTKEPDLTAADMDAAVRTIAGSARSMGLNVEGVD